MASGPRAVPVGVAPSPATTPTPSRSLHHLPSPDSTPGRRSLALHPHRRETVPSACAGSSKPATTLSTSPPPPPAADFEPLLCLPPRPSSPTSDYIVDPTDKPREPSPKRFSIASLSRVATIKHARSYSSPMGLTGDNRSTQRKQVAAVFSNMFKPSDDFSPYSSASTTPASTPKTGPSSDRKGFFNFTFPSTTEQASPSPRRNLPPTDIIDEFAGLNFHTLLNSYVQEVATGTPDSPAEALKRQNPQVRLEHLVATASNLLDRVYSAYKNRTEALADALREKDVQVEDMANSRVRADNLKSQLDRLATEEREAREEQQLRIQTHEARIRELEDQLLRERQRREGCEDELIRRKKDRAKRTSAASDSGFESDTESMFSRASAVVSPTFEGVDDYEPEHTTPRASVVPTVSIGCPNCERVAVGSPTKNPTPLRESWNSDSPTSKLGGLFRSKQQQPPPPFDPRDSDMVKMENRILRGRIGELESALDGALEVVCGRGF